MQIQLTVAICSIPSRVDQFSALIKQLEKQAEGKPVEILSIIDNKTIKIGKKRNALVEMASGRYVAFLDDDDWVTDDYVDSILEKVEEDMDVILFHQMRFEDGNPDRISICSLDVEKDYNTPEAYYRKPSHLMATKREIILLSKYREDVGVGGEDMEWSSRVRSHLKTSSSIDKVLYHYNYSNTESESKRNYMFTVVIPTIWSSDKIYESVALLNSSYAVGEIIIINNRPEACKKKLEGEKVREFVFETNQYVNPSWNFGVSQAKFEKICILNDDVLLEDMVLHFMTLRLEESWVGLVGLSKSCYDLSDAHKDYRERNWHLEQIAVRNRGFGCALFIKKENYVPIPEDLKIWFGDDWLVKKLDGKVFRLHGGKIWADMSQSVDNPAFKQIVDQDVQNSLKYQLPWSNDFD
jgi:glycosyltransferase involved in cell wall biosynthesis